MHPPTKTLLRQINDERLKAFVEHWDRLEKLVLRVCKTKTAIDEDEAEYQELRPWLVKEYPRWEAELEMFLPPPEGEAERVDPFSSLLAVETAAGFIPEENAIASLQAAREALNQFLIALIRGR